MPLKRKSPHYLHLADKWSVRHREVKKKLWANHGDTLKHFVHKSTNFAVSSLSALMMVVTPISPIQVEQPPKKQEEFTDLNNNVMLISELFDRLPHEVRPLSPDEEQQVGDILTHRFGFSVKAEIDGKRLNRSYGYIGAEQHLMRYPGDTIHTHFDTPEEAQQFARSGMAPGRGAWGYFAPSHAEFTERDSEREKYYLAVQTFLAPDYHFRTSEYRDFFKFRKMLVVNPHNGRAMVVVIGDAGPAVWTGKHLGGSPEVMNYLERVDGRRKGPVLYFFIDDPDDTIPLGPVYAKN